MPTIRIDSFSGLMPKVHPTLLPDSSATVAHNCRLKTGKLSPLMQSSAFSNFIVRLEDGLTDMADAQTIYLWKRGERQEFLAWPGVVKVAESNLFDDTRHRIFVSGDTGVRQFELSILTASVIHPDGAGQSNMWVQTWWDGSNVESKPSPESALLSYQDGDSIVFDAVAAGSVPAGAASRTFYKVISIEGDTVNCKTQAAWTQNVDAGAFPAKTLVTDRSADLFLFVKSKTSPASTALPALTGTVTARSCVNTMFCQTWTDAYGHESACSLPSGYIAYADGGGLTASALSAGETPDGAIKRTIYKVVDIVDSKVYVQTNKNGDWEQAIAGNSFPAFSITIASADDSDVVEMRQDYLYGDQPCVYVSDKNGSGFDRHRIVMDTLIAPTCARVDALDDTANIRYTAFYQSWVDEYGYESPCSSPSDEVQYNDGQSISIDGINPCPSGAVKRRIYKVVTGTETETIQFVYEQNAISGTFSSDAFSVKDEDAGERITLMGAVPGDLDWIVNMPGGFYAGFSRGKPRQVCFSEINLPTSYPEVYKYDVRFDSVGLAVSGNTLFVLTAEKPYAITGTDPNSMTVAEISSKQACVSARSICSMNGSVFYASQDGMCYLSEASMAETVITQELFTKQQWEALNPSSCFAITHDKSIFMWFEQADGTKLSYILDLSGSTPQLTTHDDWAQAAYDDCESDGLYLIRKAV